MMSLDFKTIPTNKNWVVIYTKSRREKKTAEFCELSGIDHFLPLERRMFVYDRKKVIHTVPLFPGYLFCCCNEKEKYNLLMTHHIAKILVVIHQHQLLSDLEKIYLAQQGLLDLTPCQPVTAGQRVLILSGPLTGCEGIVHKIKGNNRLILNVDFIQQAASVEVSRMNVKLL